ncbi:uncharacterized protein LOC107480947 [Arachis duranensis]|uniref:Uncharacterized protein LOC107480947 n=1 Tax=Arachis duranensis TaxID=130453 RepID=A0A6P4CUN8_ARADU|nr:uncharacterized protein LOC107480947 [Arachis duranensis]
MERDLRQRDPLSPFLSVLVVDVLHRMIEEAVWNRCISPLLVGRDNIELSHLQFVDDTIFFYPSEEEIIRNYQRLLRCFEMMSGLYVSFVGMQGSLFTSPVPWHLFGSKSEAGYILSQLVQDVKGSSGKVNLVTNTVLVE